MDRVLLFALSFAAFAGTLFCLRHRSPLHLVGVLAAFTLFVGSFFPVATLFIEPLSWRNVILAPEDDIRAVQAEYVAFACGIAAAACVAFVSGSLARRAHGAAAARPARSDALVAGTLLVGGALLYAVYVRQVGFDALASRDDYAEKYLRAVGLGAFASGINVMIAGVLWAEAGTIGPRTRTLFRLAGVALAAWSLGIVAVRTNAVILALGYGWIACRRHGMTTATLRPAVVCLAICGWFSLELVSLWRGAVKEAGGERAAEILVRNAETNLAAVVGGSEFSHPFLTALEVRLHEHEGELGGASYWNAIPALAPLALVPDRPLALSETFARTHYAEMKEQGGGTAFSLVAEAWWNLGALWGSFLVGLLCAALLLVLEGHATRAPAGVMARVLPYAAFLCVIAHRSESAVLLKQTVAILLPVVCAVVLCDLARPLVARSTPEHRPAEAH